MKRIIRIILAIGISNATAYAYDFKGKNGKLDVEKIQKYFKERRCLYADEKTLNIDYMNKKGKEDTYIALRENNWDVNTEQVNIFTARVQVDEIFVDTVDKERKTFKEMTANCKKNDNISVVKNINLGKHNLTLQWISWENPGKVLVYEDKLTKKIFIKGEQVGIGEEKNDYLNIDGEITNRNGKIFTFDGVIKTKVSHINNGEECIRKGVFTFESTQNRKYWRLQEMRNPCDSFTDYVDIFF